MVTRHLHPVGGSITDNATNSETYGYGGGCVYTAPFICPVMSSFKAIRRPVPLTTYI